MNQETEVRRQTLADQVAERIVDQIDALGLRPGDELPSTGDLARQFGVNRLVVREAIRSLAAREILSSSQGRSARVTIPTPQVFGQMLNFRLRQRSLGFEDMLDTRRILEVELTRQAADRVSRREASCEEAYRTVDAMSAHVTDREKFVAFDVLFHQQVADLAGNATMQLILESLETVLIQLRRATYEGRRRRGDDQSATVAVHRSILDAVAQGNTEEATRLMTQHLNDTQADLRAREDSILAYQDAQD